MTMTAVARRVGAIDAVAAAAMSHAGTSARRLFVTVFALSAVTATVLSNDGAVLLLTPVVVALVRARAPRLVVPFAFAVFCAAGVAPFVISNPMNMVVASFAGIGFNA